MHNKFYITDEKHNNLFEITNKVLTIGRKTSINDMSGNELIYIEEELFKLFESHYNVFCKGNFSYKIIKRFNIIKKVYELSNGYTAEGDIFNFCLCKAYVFISFLGQKLSVDIGHNDSYFLFNRYSFPVKSS